MDAINLNYQFCLISSNLADRKFAIIKINPPYSFLGDLYHIGNRDLEPLIIKLSKAIEGHSNELIEFGGEFTICTTEGSKTYCEDIHSDCQCVVDTKSMIQMLSEFYVYRKLSSIS